MLLSEMKKTKIICTIGPASESKETLERLIEEGMNICRLNFSHGSHEEHKARIDNIKEIREKLNKPVAILLDTKGPEIRTGDFKDGMATLKKGNKFTITMDDCLGDETRCTVSYKDLASDVAPGNLILIDDGLVGLKVEEVSGSEIHCVIENEGVVKNKKGVNVPNVKINLPALTEKDKSDIIFGIENDIDFIAASFVRKPSDVLEIREVLEDHGGDDIQIFSKIENQEGVDNIDKILEVSNGIMVARGDLGVEVPTEEIPLIQKDIINKCNTISKPVITATQMLDSMIRNPRPTRAEVTDVANAILDGTDAIMLSGETAAGSYPVEAVKTMSKIAKAAESRLDYDRILSEKKNLKELNITNAISHAVCTTARDLEAKAIITATASGYTARMVSSYRPKCHIIATTSNEKALRRMTILWGVHPINSQSTFNAENLVDDSIQRALGEKLINNGDLVVVTAGVPVGQSGTTNLIKVHIASKLLSRGIGLGKGSAYGKVKLVKGTEPFEINEGDILVSVATDTDMVKEMAKAKAIVTSTGGMTSHAAIVGLSLGVPVVVSAVDIMNTVKDGDTITVDGATGAIYEGIVKNL